MARLNSNDKIQKKLHYIRTQVERFLWFKYKIKPELKFYVQKKLSKKYVYSTIKFPEQKLLSETIELDYDYDFVLKKGNKALLPIAFRDAIRIAMWWTDRSYESGNPVYEAELRKHNIPSFGTVAETGKELHSYGCIKCKRVYMYKDAKLRKSQDPSQKNIKSGCCGELFEYFGVKFYNNETLQKIDYIQKKNKGIIV